MERKCTKCGQVKLLVEFVKDKRRQTGRGSYCKACHNRLYYQKRPKPKRLEPGDMKQCSTCSELKPVEDFDKVPRSYSGYKAQCKECRRATSRAWKRNHKEEVREYQKQWRANNKAYFRKWYADHHEHCLEIQRRWYASPRGRAYNRHTQHVRRSRELVGDVTVDWLMELEATQTTCAYCGRLFGPELRPAIDHIMPLSKGGSHTMANIVLACKSCNSSKSNRIIDVFYTSPESDQPLLGCLEESQ